MKKKRLSRIRHAILLSLSLAVPEAVLAQQRPAFGGYFHYNTSMQSADFRTLEGVLSCNENNFSSATGSGFTVGGLYDLPLAEKFTLSLRASYASAGATMTASDPTVFGINGEPVNGSFDYKLTSSLASIGIEPIASYEIFSGFSLSAGLRAGFVMTKSYEQTEEINEPTKTARLPNGQTSWNEQSGDIKNASAIDAGLLGGLSYNIRLSPTLSLAPELLYSLALTPVASGVSWNANALRTGIALKFSPIPAPEPRPEPIPEPPKPEPKVPTLAASLRLNAVSAEGEEMPLSSIRIEEFLRTQSQPLIPYIFFDENSSEIPSRYSRISPDETANFSNENLYSLETLPAYQQLLNIVGKRMRDNQRATITVTGYNSGSGDEKNNTELSRRRAESVRNYLTNVWGIDQKRISVSGKNLPPKPSNTSDRDGMEENRRVELSSGNPEILDALRITDTLRTITPAMVRMRPDVSSEAGIASWTATISDGTRRISEQRGTDIASSDWIPEKDIASLRLAKNVRYNLAVSDQAGQSRTAEVSVPVDYRSIEVKRQEKFADKEIEEYSLMLFDFDKADLTPDHQRLINVIKPRIRPNSTVTIKGYTDRFGATDYNQRLSEQRAQNVARALGSAQDRALGLGESVLLYNNDLPEGRFYSRTITVMIETPTEK